MLHDPPPPPRKFLWPVLLSLQPCSADVEKGALSRLRCILALAALLPVALAVGCGGGSSGPETPVTPLSGNTSVTILATSTANDKFVGFGMTLTGLTLKSQSGKTVNLISDPRSAEFIHVNGQAEPLATVTVPQDVYTSASISVASASFGCVALDPASGALVIGTKAYQQISQSAVTVTLPAPITITGTAMGLLLDLEVSRSAQYTTCAADATFAITPTFALAPVTIATQPTNGTNGKEIGLLAVVTSVDASEASFSALYPSSGSVYSFQSSGSTVYQGIPGISALSPGMPVNMDAAVQQDGSLLATRIAVQDADADQITISSGPLLNVAHYSENGVDYVATYAYASQIAGKLLVPWNNFTYNDATFQISPQLANVQSLPFPAIFTISNMAVGQNVSITTHVLKIGPEPVYTPASTITLQPQTINGTVIGTSSEGGFTTYTVTLAPYDLFPALAVQPGQTTLLTNPNTVVVYADSNTQKLNTIPIAVGSVARFYGLVFNDNGTLRMDCAQINDGVAE